MMEASWLSVASLSALSLLTAAGCGGKMKVAPVSGVVTLDGAPLDKASVLFQPEAGGRPSFGVTDKSGRYTLAYSMHEQGAEVGSCTVKITTRLASEQADDDSADTRAPERVPAQYMKEPIKVQVEPKRNQHDFALTSKP